MHDRSFCPVIAQNAVENHDLSHFDYIPPFHHSKSTMLSLLIRYPQIDDSEIIRTFSWIKQISIDLLTARVISSCQE
jgi:hypothetical protein